MREAVLVALMLLSGLCHADVVVPAQSKLIVVQSGVNMMVTSDKYDVISCKKDSIELSRCYGIVRSEAKTPAEYAGSLGYKTLHKVSIAFINGAEFFVMEVSR